MKSECDPIRDLIADSISGTLAPAQARPLDEHLRGCPACRSYAEALGREGRLLGQLVGGVATDMRGRKEQLVQVLSCHLSKRVNDPMGWRRIMNSRIARLTAAAVVVLAAALGFSLLERSSTPVYGMTEVLELIDQAKTLHIQGWRIGRRSSPPEDVRLPFEYWYDLENGRHRLEYTNVDRDDGAVRKDFEVCDGQYVMRSTMSRQPVGQRAHPIIVFERVDPNHTTIIPWLNEYRQFRQVEGFVKIGEDTLEGRKFDIWQGEYTYGVGDLVARHRLQVWLSPITAAVGAIKHWREQGEYQWKQTSEYTRFERNVPLAPELFRTEPPATGYEIQTSKETATVPIRRNWLEEDLYEDTRFRYASLNYRLWPAFVLPDGSLLAGYRSVDGLESRDQSKYFQGLLMGGPLAKLPVEVYALSPEPNTRNVSFIGFHLAYTQKGMGDDRRWFEWILYVPNGEPPEPEAVYYYRIQYRVNVQRTEDAEIRNKQVALPDPQKIETEADFDRLVLGAMAERNDGASAPEQVTYASVLQMAQQIRALLTK
jgi:hypothetical protein